MSAEPTARDAAAGTAVSAAPPRATGRRPTPQETRQLVGESLRVANPGNNARDLPTQADPRHDCQVDLAVDAITPYERNPRRTTNAKFEEIKESIRVCGIRNPITVTRRPGAANFIVEAGGNTRLVAIQQLSAETRDPRFQTITVMFRPWQSESHVLTAHLVENDQRSELTFWDKANGVMALKRQLETEQGRELSLRQLEDELKALGLSVDKSRLSRYQYAAAKLRPLGEALSSLSGMDVMVIQPRLNLLKRYVERRAGAAGDLYAQVFNPVFEQHGARYAQTHAFAAAQLCQDCEQALAEHCGQSVTRLRMDLDALESRPDLSWEDLDAKAGSNASPARPSRVEAKAPDDAPGIAPTVPSRDSRPADPAAEIATGRVAVVRGEANAGAPAAARRIELPLPHSAASPELIQRLRDCVIQFAQLTQVADCLTLCAELPRGYYMEPPQSPLGLEPGKPLRHRAWWLLTLLSGQMQDALIPRMPETSHWRRAHEGHGDDDIAMSLLIEDELGGLVYFDAELANWLLDPADEIATLFWELVLRVRELKLVTPHESPVGTARQIPETER